MTKKTATAAIAILFLSGLNPVAPKKTTTTNPSPLQFDDLGVRIQDTFPIQRHPPRSPSPILTTTTRTETEDEPSPDGERRWGGSTVREPGRCSMYDGCGKKGGVFGQELPCAWNRQAVEAPASLLSKLSSICGPISSTWSTTCCTESQLLTLSQSLAQAEPLLALCPACRNNFRDFYCSFTCSPDQSLFVTVAEAQDVGGGGGGLGSGSGSMEVEMTRTEGYEEGRTEVTIDDDTSSGGPAVKRILFSVSPTFGTGFFDSCKDVKFGASNGYAMDFLGGGAKNWTSFLRYMGQERPGLGSPFQIDFPQPPESGGGIEPLDKEPLKCSSPDISSRCACADCPSVCLELPFLPSPDDIRSSQCRVGPMTCFSFMLVLLYAIGLAAFVGGLVFVEAWRVWGGGSGWRGGPAVSSGGGGKWGPIRIPANYGSSAGGSEVEAYGWENSEGEGDGGEYDRLRLEDPLAPEDGDEDARPLPSPNASGSGEGEGGGRSRYSPSSILASIKGGRDGGAGGGGSNRGSSPGSNSNPLVGAVSTSRNYDGESLRGSGDRDRDRGRQASTSSGSVFPGSTVSPGDSLLRRGTRPTITGRMTGTFVDDVDPMSTYQPRIYTLNTHLTTFFTRLGMFCSRRPYLTISLGLLVCGVLNSGWSRFEVERDPVRLWVSKGSESEVAKGEFERRFGQFYRTEQVIVTVKGGDGGHDELFGGDGGAGKVGVKGGWEVVDEPVLNWDRLRWWAEIESEIRSLRSEKSGIGLEDVCFAPTAPPSSSPGSDQSVPVEFCVVQSVMGYFGDSLDGVDEDTWADRLDDCVTSPALCLPASGAPLNPRLLLGGIPGYSGEYGAGGGSVIGVVEGGGGGSTVRAHEARALVITYVVRNSLDPEVVSRAEEWENTLKDYLAGLGERAEREAGLTIAYSTEVSLEEELNKSTNTDVPIVVFSYLVMFLYVSLSLGGSGKALMETVWYGLGSILRRLRRGGGGGGGGRPRSGSISLSPSGYLGSGSMAWQRLLVGSRFVLGLWGIAIVLLSVSTAVGFFSLCGVKITLIIAEVIPFLVLAIGVDNVFILAHELDRQNQKAHAAIIRASNNGVVGGVGGGGGSGMLDAESRDPEYDEDVDGIASPEERVARALGRMGPSILLSAACETVAFALGALVGMPAVRNFAIYAAGAVAINAILQVTVFVSAMTIDLRRVEARRVDCLPCLKISSSTPAELTHTGSEGFVSYLIRNFYAPLLIKRATKNFVLVLFSGLFVASWIGARNIDLGLDQRLALPTESYLVDYFNALDTYLDVGPPVYFVTEDIDVTSREGQQAVCGRFSTCRDMSIANVLEAERKRPRASFIAEPPAVWLDDFFQWLNPALESCCRVKKNNASEFCSPRDSEFRCKPCFEGRNPAWNITMDGLPEDGEFLRYLEQWLQSPTNEDCPLGGKAAYSTALDIEGGKVAASHFRTYHTPVKKQEDFINALASARRVSAELSERTGARVFPYSIFYVFFEQYAYIVSMTREVLLLALFAVFIVTSAVLGSWRTGLVVGLTVFMSVVNVMGIMGAWGVSLNAVSLVNLVISVGIAVEFCSHIARAFMGARGGGLPFGHPAGPKDRDARAYTALVDVGPSVFSGITLTKLIGISVLALTRSKLLETYYFRMWLALIVSGALHGLVFLPVALSFLGGQGYSLDREDEGWMTDTIGQRYGGAFENRPFLRNDESDDDSDQF